MSEWVGCGVVDWRKGWCGFWIWKNLVFVFVLVFVSGLCGHDRESEESKREGYAII